MPGRVKACLPPNRRDLLRDYILACVRDNVLRPSDLVDADVVGRLLAAVTVDIRYVVGDMVRSGVSNGLQLLGSMLKR